MDKPNKAAKSMTRTVNCMSTLSGAVVAALKCRVFAADLSCPHSFFKLAAFSASRMKVLASWSCLLNLNIHTDLPPKVFNAEAMMQKKRKFLEKVDYSQAISKHYKGLLSQEAMISSNNL